MLQKFEFVKICTMISAFSAFGISYKSFSYMVLVSRYTPLALSTSNSKFPTRVLSGVDRRRAFLFRRKIRRTAEKQKFAFFALYA